jgi:2-oxoglutarate dehydrogenase E2 component (dihydrolipoamide succinyltransferase)
MAIEIKVPALPESVADATIAKWLKKAGDTVTRDELLVEIETDKVMLEVPAPADGVLESILKPEGTTVGGKDVIGTIVSVGKVEEAAKLNGSITKKSAEQLAATAKTASAEIASEKKTTVGEADSSPSVRRMAAEHDVNIKELTGSGKDGRVTKDDIHKHLQQITEKVTVTETPPVVSAPLAGERFEQRVPMTRLRTRVAERLLDAQRNMAILTTFNEINMKAVMDLRTQYKDQFEKAHDVKLGFMSFFIRAAVVALKRFPDVNAFIEGNNIIYHGYCDIGVAVSTDRGLVVPVLRDADQQSMAAIEAKISEFGQKARTGKLTIEEMTGGTFTISNGGVFGSLLSTPILNPPQSAILGMHKIEERPIVEKGQIVIRPMMYVALSYDHRIIDGKDSVQFLRTIKELIEDPARLLLDV